MPGRVNQVLSRSWWVIFPGFLILVGRLTYERACADPYRLLAGAMSTPAAAWPIALLYVAAHGWLLATYLQTVANTGSLWPAPTQLRAAWHGNTWKVLLLAAALVIEYWPVSILRILGAALC